MFCSALSAVGIHCNLSYWLCVSVWLCVCVIVCVGVCVRVCVCGVCTCTLLVKHATIAREQVDVMCFSADLSSVRTANLVRSLHTHVHVTNARLESFRRLQDCKTVTRQTVFRQGRKRL